MNGEKKFHNPNGPAFNAGEVWVAAGGSRAVISHTERYGLDKWSVHVFYYFPTDAVKRLASKDAWNFQVRYQHQADKEI